MTAHSPRALVLGWFSLDETVATVGDLLGGQVTADWLAGAGYACDTAVASYLGTGVDWRAVDPADYDLVVFTTGPLFPRAKALVMLDRFAGRPLWAVNVSLLDPALAGRFDRVWTRDGHGTARPDLAIAGRPPFVPVVAVAYAPPQPEYGDGRHATVEGTVREWLADRGLAAVELDMDMYADHRHPRSPGQVDALVARADVVVSMRLHAMIAALRHDRPVVALDPVAGGGKITRQAEVLGWPCVLPAERCTPAELDDALAWCLTPWATGRARRARLGGERQAAALAGEVRAAAVALDQASASGTVAGS